MKKRIFPIILLLLMVLLTGCGNQKSYVPLKDSELLAIHANALPTEFIDSQTELSVTEGIYINNLQAPVCVIEYVLDTNTNKKLNNFYFVSVNDENFTTNLNNAKTVIYVVANEIHKQFQCYALKSDFSNHYPLLERYAYMGVNNINDLSAGVDSNSPEELIYKKLLSCYPISQDPSGGVDEAIKTLTQNQTNLDASTLNTYINAAYNAISAFDFYSDEADNILAESYFNDYITHELGPVLAVNRNNAPDKNLRYTGGYSRCKYPQTEYDEWINNAELTYIKLNAQDDYIETPAPKSVLVCENISYYYMGEFSKVGDIYSYVTRFTLYDINNNRIVAFKDVYNEASDNGYGTKQIVDKDYQTDSNGKTVYDLYATDPERVLKLYGNEDLIIKLK